MLIVQLTLLLILIINVEAWNKALTRRIIASSVAGMSLCSPMLPALADDSTATVTVASPSSMSFGDFVPYLQRGNIVKVVFKGVRPTALTAFTKDGKEITVQDGFPAFDDPLSASGPQQAIALCQHTPGVEVYQDIADILSLSKTSKGYRGPQKMLQSNSYPKEYAYDKQ